MKRKTLTTALLAGLTGAVGIANISNAVNLNPDGLGQVLLYPYYTVRNGTDTLISVVNTHNEAKAVKVRFLEGENSREVLDFNLYLSPFDVWTAAVTEADDGSGAVLNTSDATCTVGPVDGVAFRQFQYTGANADGGSTTLDRTKEGHLEMIEMGVVTGTKGAATLHSAGPDCATLTAAWSGGDWTQDPNDEMQPPTGGLFGGASLIQVDAGFDVGYNANALDSFSQAILHRAPGTVFPNLNDQNSAGGLNSHTSFVFNDGSVVQSSWNRGVDAVSALFMHNTVMNEYVLDAATLSGTDWVMNFPTKNFYVDPATSGSSDPVPPFTTTFDGDMSFPGTACEAIGLTIWDREEQTPGQDIGLISPPSPGPTGSALCWETTILTFDNSDVLGSVLSENVNPSDAGFEDGWARIAFNDPDNTITSTDGDVYKGLPVAGFAVQTFTNGTLTDDQGTAVLSNYAGLFNHRNTRDISGT